MNEIYIIHLDRRPFCHSKRGLKSAVTCQVCYQQILSQIKSTKNVWWASLCFVCFIGTILWFLTLKKKENTDRHISTATHHCCHLVILLSLPFWKANWEIHPPPKNASIYHFIYSSSNSFLIAVKWDLSFCMQRQHLLLFLLCFPRLCFHFLHKLLFWLHALTSAYVFVGVSI